VPPVAIVTDSTHYMPREIVERHGFHTVSLYVRWGDPPRDDREADLPDFDGFYAHLRTAPELPTTSQPSVGDFLAVYEPLIEQGSDILSIHLSGGISGTVRSAEQALAEAAARARKLREGMKILFAVDTLEFLRRGGRIGGAQAWFGSTLKIKPILAIEYEIVAIERVRTWGRAFERMVDHLSSLREDGNDRFFVQHIRAPDQAEKLAQRGEAIYGRPPEFVSEMGPVIGAHAGPGLIGVTALRHDVLGPI
jgi:fatty acid kinase fatty acid binding subunit